MTYQRYDIRDGAQTTAECMECALRDDLCICTCSPAPTLVAGQCHDFQIVAGASAA